MIKVFMDVVFEGKCDCLVGLKENVIIGKLILVVIGLWCYWLFEIELVELVYWFEEDMFDE